MTTGNNQERLAYPQLPEPINSDVLNAQFTPWRDEVAWAFEVTRSEETCLGLLVLLKTFEALGRFIAVNEIPPEIIRHIAKRADLVEKDRLVYPKRTLARHYLLIREFLGVREWDTDAREVAERTMEQSVASRTQPADLINAAVEVLIRERFELPALRTLRRLAGTVQQRIHNRLFDRVANHLTEAHRTAFDGLLEVPKDADESPFAQLCRPPGRATAKNLSALVDHLDWLATLAVPPAALADIMPVKIEQWADEAKRLIATELREYQTPRRHALLAALVHVSRGRLLDDLVTMLIKSMRKIRHQADADLQAWLAERQESSEQLIIILLDLARAHQGIGVQGFSHQAAVIFAAAGGSDQIVKRCEARLEHRVRDWRPFARKHFVQRRSALMDLGEVLPLKAMPGSEGLLHAFNSVVAWRSYREAWIKAELDTSFLDRGWAKHVRDPDEPGVYNRRLLEVAAFFELAEALQSGAVYVPESSSYGAYTDHLYPIESDSQAVATYLQGRGLPDNADAFVTELRDWLNSHIRNLDSFVGELGVVELNGEGLPIVRRPPANKPTDSALALEKVLLERLPQRTILEALYNTDAWTRWTRHFGPPARIAPQLDNPVKRYVLTTFAYGCGLGPTQASRHFKEAVPTHRLAFANRRHVSTVDLRAACNDLINLYAEFGLPHCWGSGKSAAADGSLLETYEENLFAAHHVRYGRSGGIAYRHVADTYIALFSHFIPCGVHEAVYILDSLLKNASDVQPRRVHADTHGQSATVFALGYLLGNELIPQLDSFAKKAAAS